MPLVVPTDICLLRKEKIVKMGKIRSSNNPDDFVMAKVHYHQEAAWSLTEKI